MPSGPAETPISLVTVLVVVLPSESVTLVENEVWVELLAETPHALNAKISTAARTIARISFFIIIGIRE